VLRVLQTSPKPLSAHELAGRLLRDGKHVRPAGVYRCLARLMHVGEVPRVPNKNAYCRAAKVGQSVRIFFCARYAEAIK
jgi:Fe2+ or Zn2+ uptake regulation protein